MTPPTQGCQECQPLYIWHPSSLLFNSKASFLKGANTLGGTRPRVPIHAERGTLGGLGGLKRRFQQTSNRLPTASNPLPTGCAPAPPPPPGGKRARGRWKTPVPPEKKRRCGRERGSTMLKAAGFGDDANLMDAIAALGGEEKVCAAARGRVFARLGQPCHMRTACRASKARCMNFAAQRTSPGTTTMWDGRGAKKRKPKFLR
jgi:hypothetical protein